MSLLLVGSSASCCESSANHSGHLLNSQGTLKFGVRALRVRGTPLRNYGLCGALEGACRTLWAWQGSCVGRFVACLIFFFCWHVRVLELDCGFSVALTFAFYDSFYVTQTSCDSGILCCLRVVSPHMLREKSIFAPHSPTHHH